MKFGPVPVASASGAILAHSLQLPGGRLRKGVMLTPEHLARLSEAHIKDVVVARLEQDDLHEDVAAQTLAQACIRQKPGQEAGPLHLTSPFTGRVNLIADHPGIVLLDSDKVIAANEVDPAITVATVPPCRQMHAGGMIATIKIIPYAVPQRAVAEAADRLTGAIRLAVPVYATASLIVTDVPGGPGLKGQQAVEDRLTGLGLSLIETRVCPHDETALAREIAEVSGEVVLILTASATSDASDTAPAALRLVGGHVTRFGIPVDPGNLLFLGRLDDKPVIGLPGSARSSVLHGADWVLARVVCGLQISARDFAAMGVGGLLKEIPTRPQPRRARPAG